MQLKAKIAATILIVDTFLLSFAYGFKSRHVLIVDPTLPQYVAPKVEEKPAAKIKDSAAVADSKSKETAHADAAKSGATADQTNDSSKSAAASTKKTGVGATAKHGAHTNSKKAHGTK